MQRKSLIVAASLGALVLVTGGVTLWMQADGRARDAREQVAADLAYADAEAERQRLAEEAARRRLYQEALARREAAWASRLDTARNLASGLSLSGSDITCDLEAPYAPRRTTGDANADLLLAVAEQPLTVFFVHGFQATAYDGRQSIADMRPNFADHAKTARAAPGGSAFCYVSWNSQAGFGDEQLHLARAISAVRRLQADPLTVTVAPPAMVVIGYSAGGNFAKHAVVHALDHPAQAVVPEGPGAQARIDALAGAAAWPPLRLVALGTPHGGGDLADVGTGAGEGLGALMQLIGGLAGDQQLMSDGRQMSAGMRDYRNLRGVRQLSRSSSELSALNGALANRLGAIQFFNIYSRDDDVISVASALWNRTYDRVYDAMRHRDFKYIAENSSWRPLWSEIYALAPSQEPAAFDPTDKVSEAERAVIADERNRGGGPPAAAPMALAAY